MMMFIMFFMFLFMFNINKILTQMFYQNMIFIIMFLMMLYFPMSNLNMWFNLYYNLGMDYYSFSLILLSLWILSLMMMISGKIFMMNNYNIYMLMLKIMLISLILCFYSMNMIMFYIFFEISLIPMFFIIMSWGYQIERIQASFYMMLYTLLGSMPLFLIIMNLYKIENCLMMSMINISNLNLLVYLSLIMAFLIKMPMYMFHLWLPKAHVEAPVMGSMILAGIMLKLGSYGMMRVMLMMEELSIKFNKFIIIFSMLGGLLGSLICLYQIDMKMLIAYSSVVHMSSLMSGLMTLFDMGYYGGILMMIAHGLCSSGLFCLVYINYERVYSRSLYMNKGMMNLFPSLSLMWFFLSSSNLSFPMSLNLFGEITLFNSLIMWSELMIYILMMLSFFSSCYTLYIYSYSQHGNFSLFIISYKEIMVSEYMLLLYHWLPLNLLFMYVYMFM